MNIIIHHSLTKDSETVSWGAIRRYHLSLGWNDIGYHAGIELINDHYEILLGRMFDQDGAHTRGHNHDIGICCVGNFDIRTPPMEQWNLCVELVKYFKRQLNIVGVYGHREFDKSKTCPGIMFDMDLFRNEVR